MVLKRVKEIPFYEAEEVPRKSLREEEVEEARRNLRERTRSNLERAQEYRARTEVIKGNGSKFKLLFGKEDLTGTCK